MGKILYEQVLQGKQAENEFKKKPWNAVKEGLNRAFQIDLEATQLKMKWLNRKRDYNIYTMIKSNSGFRWDSQWSILTAPNSIGDAYLKAQREAEKFQSKFLANYLILNELCINLSATGEYALSTNITFRSDFPSQKSQQKFSTHGEITAAEMLTGGERRGDERKEEGDRMENIDAGGGVKKKTMKGKKQNAAEKESEDKEEEAEERLTAEKKVKAEWKTVGHAITQALDHHRGTTQTI
ncbi:hypothetical protein L873DRAFT_1849591 [Choiromyces venosus 120613-1]|uniref:Myb/SANT-like domain-containing protein n=1 Tax=Choiromyces venosus 120613-1 TaxID=1336337 RepID=A0A3N4IS98_9PEZI|nr:hypothetical protein L873DRAFT_1849591 [Choiromyces venosus 120613-1]